MASAAGPSGVSDTIDLSNDDEARNTSTDLLKIFSTIDVSQEITDEAELKLRRKMTKKECQRYILFQIGIIMKKDLYDPLCEKKRELAELHAKLQTLNDECMRLRNVLDTSTKHQRTFLRKEGKLDEFGKKSVGVWVDLPLLTEQMPETLKRDLMKKKNDNSCQSASPPFHNFIRIEPGILIRKDAYAKEESDLRIIELKSPECRIVNENEPEILIEKVKESKIHIKKEPGIHVKKELEISVKKEPEFRVKKEPEFHVKKEPEIRVKKESEIRVKKEPECRVKKEPEIRVKKEPGVRIKKEPDNFEVIDLTDDDPEPPIAAPVRNTYQHTLVKSASQFIPARATYQTTPIRATYQPTAVRTAYKATAVRAYKPTAVRTTFQPTAVRSAYQSTTVRAYQPTAVRPTAVRPTAVRATAVRATAVRSTIQPTAIQPTAIRATYQPATIRATYQPATIGATFQPATIGATYQPMPVRAVNQTTYQNLNRFVFSGAALPTGLVRNVPQSFFLRPAAPARHPAPVPGVPLLLGQPPTQIPPKPLLKISVNKNGLVLQWDMPPMPRSMKITGFEIFGYQEKSGEPASSSLWKKIGGVNPMPLPMSCTLTHFMEGFKYHFSIRAVVNYNKYGYFSDPASIMFVPNTQSTT